jgi:fibronectin-binding autotransporter adhesin
MTSPCVRGALWCAALSFAVMAPLAPRAAAITITMEYTDEGDPLPHDENPSWDPGGVILKQHFVQAKQIWESLLPGPGAYEFDFHWDDDIGADVLGLTTDLGPLDLFIEINPLHDWFADPTPGNDDEFNVVGEQTLFQNLSQADRDANFPGAPPPVTLETGYHLPASGGPVGAGGFDAQHGYDLLTVILHEMGHALGINGTEPGEYNMFPQHIGGLQNALVAESDGGGHLAGGDPPGFLMRETGIPKGQRVLPSATDVLVLAEDQGITNVHLARVGSLADGAWSAPGPWIGGAAPDATQGVYISHGGTTTLDVNAQAPDVWINSGSQLLVGSRRLDVKKSLLLNNGDVAVDAGGTVAANSIAGATSDLATTAGSLVRFNNFANAAATANFNGSVAVGYDTGLVGSAMFDPAANSTWNIAQDLAVGDETKAAVLVINEGADFNSATGKLGGSGGPTGSSGQVRIDGVGSTWTVAGALTARNGGVEATNGGRLTTGSATVGAGAGVATMEVNNGTWNVGNNLDVGPSAPTGDGGGAVSIRNGGVVHVTGNVSVRGTSTRMGQINIRSAGSLNVDGAVTVGPNSVVAFHDEVRAQGAMIGAAGYDNLGGPADFGTGGVTQFNDQASAGGAHFTNRGGGSRFALGGRTEFRNFSTAQYGQFDNYPGAGSIYGGVTRFFDFATAGNGDFYNHPGAGGYAIVEFNGDSTGGDARFTNLPGVLGQSLGGELVFNDRSTAGRGFYTSLGEGGGATFNDSSSADHGTFVTTDNIGGNSVIRFNENSTAGNATFSVRANRQLSFYQNSTAAEAHITARGGYVNFSGDFSPINAPSTTAGNARIVLEGGAAFGAPGGHASFSTGSTAGNATITAQGGTAAGAQGGDISFDYAAHAGNATLVANGGTNGGAGGAMYFRRGATGDNARIIVNQGGSADFGGNIYYGGTSVGSIEGAGTFVLNGSELRTGSLNTTTTVSGPLVDVPGTAPDGRLTKVGLGKLTLAAASTYTGLTTIDAGALAITGSIIGGALVRSGATLEGSGTIAGAVTVAPGGIVSPGSSPGTLTVGGLHLAASSVLNFELGATSDKLAVNGDLTLDGILNLVTVSGPGTVNVDLLTYSGSLTNNGLSIGSVPAGFSPSDFSLDASVPGRIRLVGGHLPADFDGDGVVDAADLARWSAGFGLVGAANSQGDSDGDADVDGADFLAWQRQLGLNAAVVDVRAMPEPGSGWLLIVGAIALSVRNLQTSRQLNR